MKTILKLLCLLITINVSCQVTGIVPLNSYDYPNGSYVKDTNNELTFLVGTWEGTADNIKYTFQFTLFTQVLKTYKNGIYEYNDDLKGKFKAVNVTTNQVLYDNLSATEHSDYKILELYIRQQKEFDFRFADTESNCYNRANFKLVKNDSNPNQIIYKDFELGSYGGFSGCDNFQSQDDIPLFLPTTNLVLTKQ